MQTGSHTGSMTNYYKVQKEIRLRKGRELSKQNDMWNSQDINSKGVNSRLRVPL